MPNTRAMEKGREIPMNYKYAVHQWTHVFGKNVLESFKNRGNPMADIIDKMVVNYSNGGFFTIKHVKWDAGATMYLDF